MSHLVIESPACDGHFDTFLPSRLNEGLLLGVVTDGKFWKPKELDGVLVNVIDGPSTTRVVYSESP